MYHLMYNLIFLLCKYGLNALDFYNGYYDRWFLSTLSTGIDCEYVVPVQNVKYFT